MKNKYVDFITDEHFLACIQNLHNSYLRAKADISKRKFYNNKIDTFKLTFDSKFNKVDEESIIEVEILRQIDKSINNSIGTFHEQILGGIKGYEVGQFSGFDIKAEDNTLFADIVVDEPGKYEEAIFLKIANTAKLIKNATFYFVVINKEDDYSKQWKILKEESSISHKRMFKISLNLFYDLLSGQEGALNKLSSALPIALADYFKVTGLKY